MSKAQQQQRKPQGRSSADYAVQINAYKAAFGKHYPHHQVDVKTGKGRNGETVFHVIIAGDKGDRPLTLQDMQEATQAFLQ